MAVSPREPVRPSVLIIPGLNGHPGMLLRAAPRLFPGWRPHAFNHHHDFAEGGVEGMADRAVQLITEPAFVCGESFGGTIALTLAHRSPEKVRGLILLSTFGWHPSGLARRGVAAMALWSFLGGRVGMPLYRAGRLASLPTQLGLRFSSELFSNYIQRPRADVEAYRKKVELSLTFDARPWLRELQIPALILAGTWDPVVPPSAGRELALRLPNARLHLMPGGHLVHLVHADRVGDLISEWARTVH